MNDSFYKRVAVAAALVSLAGVPAIALADSVVSGPIVVSDVQVVPDDLTDSVGVEPGSVSVTFRNEGNVAATRIVFDLQANGICVQRITDVGIFSPGITVQHEFAGFSSAPDQNVAVDDVTFEDGTEWTAPGVIVPFCAAPS